MRQIIHYAFAIGAFTQLAIAAEINVNQELVQKLEDEDFERKRIEKEHELRLELVRKKAGLTQPAEKREDK